jgi:hypothetical protein
MGARPYPARPGFASAPLTDPLLVEKYCVTASAVLSTAGSAPDLDRAAGAYRADPGRNRGSPDRTEPGEDLSGQKAANSIVEAAQDRGHACSVTDTVEGQTASTSQHAERKVVVVTEAARPAAYFCVERIVK